jgi:hypothetical protein
MSNMQKWFIDSSIPLHVRKLSFLLKHLTWECCGTEAVDISAVEDETTMLAWNVGHQLDIWTLEDETTMLSWNLRYPSPSNAVPHARRMETSRETFSNIAKLHVYHFNCSHYLYYTIHKNYVDHYVT